jgi:hypothetical protein
MMRTTIALMLACCWSTSSLAAPIHLTCTGTESTRQVRVIPTAFNDPTFSVLIDLPPNATAGQLGHFAWSEPSAAREGPAPLCNGAWRDGYPWLDPDQQYCASTWFDSQYRLYRFTIVIGTISTTRGSIDLSGHLDAGRAFIGGSFRQPVVLETDWSMSCTRVLKKGKHKHPTT